MTFEKFRQEYKVSLNPQQEKAVQAVEGATLLLAVPGSGKTTVLVHRLGYMIYSCGISPSQILTMTYTKAATLDMKSRFIEVFGTQFEHQLKFSTINSFSNQIIKYYEKTKNRIAFQIPNDKQIDVLLGEIYGKLTNQFALESEIKEMKTIITYVKNSQLSKAEIEEIKMDADISFASIYNEYCAIMRSRGWMDYDDQIRYAYEILRKHPDILAYFQNTYQYVCVDEAQDTSKIQHSLIQLIVNEHHNIFMVGDEDQSIYGFRAAYPEGLLNFEQTYKGASVLYLEHNYRSTEQIVAHADKVIQKNQYRHKKRMISTRHTGNPIESIWVYDRKAQYSDIIKYVENLKQETAILYRDNDSVIPIIDILHRKGIAYRCREIASNFFSHYIVRDLTDILLFSFNQTDAERFLRIYYKFGIGLTKVAAEKAVASFLKTNKPILQSLAEMEELKPWTREQVKELGVHLRHAQSQTAEEALRCVLYDMRYDTYLKNRNADQNKVSVLQWLAANEKTITDFLARLEELSYIVREGTTDANSNLILSTIHSSKGLEYHRVILLDVLDGILPKEAREASEQQIVLEEERRLFYVAATRAKEELAIVRYRKQTIESSFAEELLYAKKQEIQLPESTASAESFSVHRNVTHVTYGAGKIKSKQDGIVTIQFDNGDRKSFDLNACIRKGLLNLG